MSWLTQSFSPVGTLKLPVDNGVTGGNLTLDILTQHVVAAVPAVTALSVAKATSLVAGVVRPDGSTISVATDGTIAVVGSSVSGLADIGTPAGSDLVVLSRGGTEYRTTVGALPASAPTVAKSNAAGIVKPDGTTLQVASDGTLSVITASVTSLTTGSGIGATDVVVVTTAGGNDNKYTFGAVAAATANNLPSWPTSGRPLPLAPGQVSIGYNSTLASIEFGVGQSNGSATWTPLNGSGSGSNTPQTAYATQFALGVSGTTVTAGNTVTVTVTPQSGAWSGQTITPTVSGVTGTFSPTSSVGSGTTAATFTFTPSSTGTATINATVSGLTSTGAKTVTVSAASGNPAPGPTIVFDSTPGFVTGIYGAYALSQYTSGNASPITLPNKWCIEFSVLSTQYSHNGNEEYINIGLSDGTNTIGLFDRYLVWSMKSNGTLVADAAQDSNGSPYLAGATQFVTMDYDGTNLNLTANGVSIAHGPATWTGGSNCSFIIRVLVDSRFDNIRISNKSRYPYGGAAPTVPSAALTADSNTVALYNFDAQSGVAS